MEQEMEVIAHAQTDPETFGRLYDMYYQPVFGFMYSRTGNADLAKDLVSETFFQALKNLHRYKPRAGATFKSWLFAIAVAQIGNYYRSRTRFLEVTTDEAPDIIGRDDFRPDVAYRMGEDAVALEGQIELLRRMMGKLNQRQQDILTLRFFSHMSVPDIGRTLHMKEGTIKSHIHRALKKLQVLMLEQQNPQSSTIQDTRSKTYEPRTT